MNLIGYISFGYATCKISVYISGDSIVSWSLKSCSLVNNITVAEKSAVSIFKDNFSSEVPP